MQAHRLGDPLVLTRIDIVGHDKVNLITNLLPGLVKHEGPGRPQIRIEQNDSWLKINENFLDQVLIKTNLGRYADLFGPINELTCIKGSIIDNGRLIKHTFDNDARGGGAILLRTFSIVCVEELVFILREWIPHSLLIDVPFFSVFCSEVAHARSRARHFLLHFFAADSRACVHGMLIDPFDNIV